ncbi:MAG: hypothetical protein QME14_09165 [Methanobacteriaceae archaeon]|nr:hypothetical protein [Methanobacteriaceae archaeon]
MVNKKARKWQRYEKEKAKNHGGKHVGGPGKPDYTRGKVNGEVKNWKNKMTKPQLQELIKKGRNEIECMGGFTEPAIKYCKRYHPTVKLLKKGKELK